MQDVDYQKLVESYPRLRSVLPEVVLQVMKRTDKKTRKHLSGLWSENIHYNVKNLLPKFGWLNDGFAEIGRKKAVVAIGSGPSLKKNEDYLKMLSLADGTRSFEDQDYILMASNHQLKPCLEKGIIPHFAMVADGSPHLKDQMDVGENGKHTILIASVTAHPDVVENWKGPVRFICQKNQQVRGEVSKALGRELDPNRCVIEGGNILNLSFILSIALFRASVWMCVGNDLSFPIKETKEESRENYYADGDYSTNLASKRDEAGQKLAWCGFEFQKTPFLMPREVVNLKLLYTSPQLFVYKMWLETNASILWEEGYRFTIYNCSEGGILGVCLKEDVIEPENYKEKFNEKNWFLLDEISRGKWRTQKFWKATEEFHRAKENLLHYQNPSAMSPIRLGARLVTV